MGHPLMLIQRRQQLLMQLFPRDSYSFARLQVLHATGYFFVPSRLNGLVRIFQTVEQSVGQGGALVNRERECSFQEISDFWTHAVILPCVVHSTNVVYELVKRKPHFSQRTREMGHPTALLVPTLEAGSSPGLAPGSE